MFVYVACIVDRNVVRKVSVHKAHLVFEALHAKRQIARQQNRKRTLVTPTIMFLMCDEMVRTAEMVRRLPNHNSIVTALSLTNLHEKKKTKKKVLLEKRTKTVAWKVHVKRLVRERASEFATRTGHSDETGLDGDSDV